MLYNFDMLFIIKLLEKDEILEEIEKLKNIISKKGELIKIDLWGKKKLALEIGDCKHGFYGFINFNMDKYLADELNKNLRSNTNILRHMLIKNGDCLDKD